MSETQGRVQGLTAIVTGAASGIGRACAERLAEEGARVLLTDIQTAAGESVAQQINSAGGSAAFLEQDVRDEAQWIEIITAAEAQFAGVHILVNNAGIAIGATLTEMSLEDFQRQQAVNVDGVFLGIKHAIPAMQRAGTGSIINVSSVAGMQGAAGLAAYCATKGAVRLLSKAAAKECGANDWPVRVNSIHPGIIDTAIWNTTIPGMDNPGSNRVDIETMGASAPLKRTGQPMDIARGVVFLASDDASYITGTELVIDGGWLA